MRKPTALSPIALAFAGMIIVPAGARAAPMEITSCGPIVMPGSYVLTGNLTSTGNCLTILASVSSITIDLAGFEIAGDGSGAGILIAPGIDSVVRNGTVRNFNIGVAAREVENVRVSGTTTFGINAFTTAKNNRVEGNSGVGLKASALISENIALNNGGSGIQVAGPSVVVNNASLNNTGDGFEVDIGGSTVMSNVASGNDGIGFNVRCPAVVAFNTATNNLPNFFPQGSCTLTENRSGRF